MAGRMKVNYLTGYMSPHLLPLLNALGEHPEIDLTVWYCNADTGLQGWAHGLKPTHKFVVSTKRPMSWIHPEFHLDGSIRNFIDEHRSDLTVVSEYDIPTLRLAIAHLHRRHHAWVLRGERPVLWQQSLLRSLLGNILRHRPLRTAAAIIANGEKNAEIYRELCPWGTPVYSVPYYLDAEAYNYSREQGTNGFAELTGTQLAHDDFVFIFAGDLIVRKGVMMLVEAFNRVAENLPHTLLCIIGDGPERPEMERTLKECIRRRVFFLGKVDFEKVPLLYRSGNAFVFPTQFDGWGMVVNEAMASSLPVVTTAACGAAHDLVIEGENGYIVSTHDMKGLIEHMTFLAQHPDIAHRMGQRSRDIIEEHSPLHGAERMYKILSEIYTLNKNKSLA
jgi:glycosyltransferase involved in cell wall biosynthesis